MGEAQRDRDVEPVQFDRTQERLEPVADGGGRFEPRRLIDAVHGELAAVAAARDAHVSWLVVDHDEPQPVRADHHVVDAEPVVGQAATVQDRTDLGQLSVEQRAEAPFTVGPSTDADRPACPARRIAAFHRTPQRERFAAGRWQRVRPGRVHTGRSGAGRRERNGRHRS